MPHQNNSKLSSRPFYSNPIKFSAQNYLFITLNPIKSHSIFSSVVDGKVWLDVELDSWHDPVRVVERGLKHLSRLGHGADADQTLLQETDQIGNPYWQI